MPLDGSVQHLFALQPAAQTHEKHTVGLAIS